MTRVSRRDFLKIGSALSGAFTVQRMLPQLSDAISRPNILIFVFDAMSAKNLSLYGYRRKTTPNFERFAQRATVYNQHYAAGNFTTPGTASMLTGLYPWTHRAFNPGALVARSRVEENLFRALGTGWYRFAFSQNVWANYLLAQFDQDIERKLSPSSFSSASALVGDRLSRDEPAALRAFDDFLFRNAAPPPSLVFGLLERMMLRRALAAVPGSDKPRSIPHILNYPIFFRLKDVFNGLTSVVDGLTPPFAAYLHTWSPHEPYLPAQPFDQMFADGWAPEPKPFHALGSLLSPQQVAERRQKYDEYVANLDFEFGALLDSLEAKGILNQSYVIVTSDHGEMLERGMQGHTRPVLFDPVVRIPLIISSPGQASRQDIHIPTSSVDLLPTLVHLAGQEPPTWTEGQILPGVGGPDDPHRSIYMMDAKESSAYGPLRARTSFALRKGPHKLTYYQGFPEYGGKDAYELYNIENDPEELKNLYPRSPSFAKALRDELLTKIDAENEKF